MLLRTTSLLKTTLSPNLIGGGLSEGQLKSIEELTQSRFFQNLVLHMEANEERW